MMTIAYLLILLAFLSLTWTVGSAVGPPTKRIDRTAELEGWHARYPSGVDLGEAEWARSQRAVVHPANPYYRARSFHYNSPSYKARARAIQAQQLSYLATLNNYRVGPQPESISHAPGAVWQLPARQRGGAMGGQTPTEFELRLRGR